MFGHSLLFSRAASAGGTSDDPPVLGSKCGEEGPQAAARGKDRRRNDAVETAQAWRQIEGRSVADAGGSGYEVQPRLRQSPGLPNGQWARAWVRQQPWFPPPEL